MTTPEPQSKMPVALKHGSRFFELAGFACGLGMMLGDKIQEWACRTHQCIGTPGISWTTVLSSALLIAPFTVGRASSGKAWEAIAAGISNRISGGKDV